MLLSYRYKIRNATPLIPVLIALLSLTAGCIHLEQSIEVKKDGAVVTSLHYSLPKEYFEACKMARSQVDELQGLPPALTPFWPWNRVAVEEYIEQSESTLLEYKKLTEGGRKHVFLIYKGKHSDAENAGIQDVVPVDIHKGLQKGFRVVKVPLQENLTGSTELSTQEEEKLKVLSAGMRLSFSITVPGKIISTSGNIENSNTATWEFDLERNPSLIKSLPEIKLTYRVAED
ncbi:MAG: hypothetical protein R6V56_01835 [Lentisphaeria bacterium]